MLNRRHSRWFATVTTALFACAVASAQEQGSAPNPDDWVSVAKSDRTEVFARPASLHWDGDWLSLRTRQNFVEPQPAAKKGKSFLSARNEYRFDCSQRRLAYREIEAFAEPDLKGPVVQKTKIGEKSLKWMDAAEGTVFGVLLDYACGHAPPGP